MTFGARRYECLLCADPVADLCVRSFRARDVGLVDDNDVGEVEHRDLLQLKPGAVLRAHNENRFVDSSVPERHGFLSDADGFHEDDIEPATFELRQPAFRLTGQSTARPRVARLRMNTRSSCE